MHASGHPGLKIKILHYCSLYNACVLHGSVVPDSLWPHGLQPARLLFPWDFSGKNTEWVAISYPRGSSQSRNQTCVSCGSCIGRQVLHHWTPLEAHCIQYGAVKYTKAQPFVEVLCGWQCTPDMWTNLCDWTCECMSTTLKSSQLPGAYVGNLLYINLLICTGMRNILFYPLY